MLRGIKIMKFIVLLALIVMPSFSFAKGKITLEPNYSLKSGKVGGQAGVSIYEPLFLGLFYNQWTGAGLATHQYDDSVLWFTSKHSLDFHLGPVGLGAGYKFNYNNAEHMGFVGPDHMVFVKASYELW